jgi:hypothetical protein
MKNVNENQNIENNQNIKFDFQPSFEMNIYNEMLETPSKSVQSVDVIKMIEQQFSDLNLSATKRNFLLKEISNYLK